MSDDDDDYEDWDDFEWTEWQYEDFVTNRVHDGKPVVGCVYWEDAYRHRHHRFAPFCSCNTYILHTPNRGGRRRTFQNLADGVGARV